MYEYVVYYCMNMGKLHVESRMIYVMSTSIKCDEGMQVRGEAKVLRVICFSETTTLQQLTIIKIYS